MPTALDNGRVRPTSCSGRLWRGCCLLRCLVLRAVRKAGHQVAEPRRVAPPVAAEKTRCRQLEGRVASTKPQTIFRAGEPAASFGSLEEVDDAR